MADLQLEFPCAGHELRANRFKEEFFEHHEIVINGSALFDRMDFGQWLEANRKNRDPKTVGTDG